ncbi:MAG TPA: alpha/beta fold hydrolase, partial [Polyangia bacterium]
VMLLHGWMATADLNWCGAYGDLVDAGYRVLAIDHRGHGRGLRPLAPFRLADCAGDAAAALRALGAAPAIVVGYSMGGAIAQLVAREYPEVVGGLILSGTAQHWQDPASRRVFKAMGALGLMLSMAPRATWAAGLRRVGLRESPDTAWALSAKHPPPRLRRDRRAAGRLRSGRLRRRLRRRPRHRQLSVLPPAAGRNRHHHAHLSLAASWGCNPTTIALARRSSGAS